MTEQNQNLSKEHNSESVLEPEIMTAEEIAAQDAPVTVDAELEDETAEAVSEDKAEVTSENTEESADEEHEVTETPKEEKKADETDWRDAYIRMRADFENYRKRTAHEHDDVRRRERERVNAVWLDVYDNAERALDALPEKEGPWFDGFSSLVQQMNKCLATLGIKPADDMGKLFDAKRHEAIGTCPNPAMANNTIIHVERRGFLYENGDVARIARVIVVKNPS